MLVVMVLVSIVTTVGDIAFPGCSEVQRSGKASWKVSIPPTK